ncbi:hypothetical protein FK220_004450 [Flavobacteriaceae bacterium TP-CH-4]|uniref:Uncharacterized protein n=1 Tax=Pelagihabitans pacificus TaxID=2696054 RepID=A0A967E5G8_9FLAO|nr:hypothetical protein [Pelagihabitans pacificus]NHF58575.1 hypothetical protein [Pelagihabitans pacificus]
MKAFRTIIIVFALLQACTETTTVSRKPEVPVRLLTEQHHYKAGDSVELQFESDLGTAAFLVVRNGIGTSILTPEAKNDTLRFRIPDPYVQKAGPCQWELFIRQNSKASGTLYIRPAIGKKLRIETYLGPRSISAGGDDYSMLVSVPVDRYDNPLPDSTLVVAKKQFKEKYIEKVLRTQHMVAWTTLSSPSQTGRLLISAACGDVISKELTSKVYAAKPVDFQIAYERNHGFADGNQVITFRTDRVHDAFGNTIGDGTLVAFEVIDEAGHRLQTTGTSLNGIAQARLLHPMQRTHWKITAYIAGAAKSNTLKVEFESAVLDYQVLFSNDSRTLTIGPLKSFMGQLVPDGMPIKLTITNDKGDLVKHLRTTSRNGLGIFDFSAGFWSEGTYQLQVETAGIRKVKTIDLP